MRRIRELATLNMQSKGKTEEGVNDPVTDGDMLSHIAMYHSLRKAFPTLEIVSEEHDTANVDTSSVEPANTEDPKIKLSGDHMVFVKDVTVWIDPLDATKEYTEDLRQYVTTMVGVAVKGVPTIGVVHRPFSDETHWGSFGHGLSSELVDVMKLPPPELTEGKLIAPRIIVSISHQGAVKDVATAAFGDGTTIIPAAGAGFKILEVIQRNADAYVHTTAIKKWDLCAGHAILRAVGGTLTSLEGEDITYSDRQQYKVEQGLLATVSHQDLYLAKLKSLKVL